MKIIPLDKLEVRRRQRSRILAGPLNELRESILSSGLLHPPVAWFDNETSMWVLTAGERRLEAIRSISSAHHSFRCADTEVPPGHIPITPLGDYLDETGIFAAELDENIHRVDLEWQDKARALSDLHTLRVSQNPRHLQQDTAREVVEKRGGPVTQGTINRAAVNVRDSVLISQHLTNEKISSARNAAEAIQLIYKQEDEKIQAALVRRRLAALPQKPLLEVRNGDLLKILPVLEPGSFDLILADPPYGIAAGSGGFRARTVHHHNYEDTPENARAIATTIILEGFRIAKDRANLFLFCDVRLFAWLVETSLNCGWAAFPRPLIWQKSDSEGLAPWGNSGPRITTEFIFYATKGRRGLNASPTDVLRVNRVPRNERIHAAEKPVELLTKLIESATLPGDSVIDPCCGSGSSLVACRETRRTGLGIELDPDYYNTALSNVHGQAAAEVS